MNQEGYSEANQYGQIQQERDLINQLKHLKRNTVLAFYGPCIELKDCILVVFVQ